MSTGRVHDKATQFWSLPFGLIVGLFLGSKSGICAYSGFLFGGLWLSPDLDTQSRSYKRWGPIKAIWLPYQKFVPHRSILSHSPFLGTALRVSYVIIWLALALIIIDKSKLDLLSHVARSLQQTLENDPLPTFSLLFGIEGSAWLHLIKDGDPIPKEIEKILRK